MAAPSGPPTGRKIAGIRHDRTYGDSDGGVDIFAPKAI
jgi:hypothetical protein